LGSTHLDVRKCKRHTG